MENPAESFFGGMLIEIFIACISNARFTEPFTSSPRLYGITTLQSFIYFQKYQNDTPSLKLMVAAIWILETAHTAFCMQVVYSYLVSNFGEFEYFLNINWGVGVTVITEVVISTLVQAFYVRRVWISQSAILSPPLSNKAKFLTAFIAAITVCRIGFGIGSTILSYQFGDWVSFRAHKSSLATVSGGLGAAALVDVLVALTLSFYLTRGRSSWQKASNSKINLIMLYAVNSGAITASASVLSVILYATQTDSLVFLGLVEIQGKLYANSFLGSLNARSHIRNKNNAAQYPSFEFSNNSAFRAVAPPVPKVEVYQQTIVTNDMGEPENDFNMKNLKGGELV
ncbi:hypothetical protein PYCCODRAFT_1501688 [Trametes coccinea BRFM310]|uniref:DUF6534 domain-containing protein n=1 Tax=Trametes coccinea (strain BRFM310) TaxID=1353009 RepID=A0A1Y2IKQ2_TRAC3|nr:hypothetical protein PYCCODRAFT_1501688 [Trametes coccinea BRFM310]